MDCAAFFEEIRREFVSRGLEFRYSPERFVYGDLFKVAPSYQANKNKFVSLGVNNKSKKDLSAASKCSGDYEIWDNCISKSQPYVIVRDDQDVEMFFDLLDMVYRLALKLAKKIGRLPDALHARMVLSSDDHPSVKRYIERYGA